MTDSSQTQLAYVTESVYGTTPSSPSFKKVRTTAVPNLIANNQYLISDEIRPDRNVSGAVKSAQSGAFDLPIELSYGSFDDLLESVMNAAYATNVLKNGVTQKSFTFESKLTTSGGTKYHRMTGVVANSFNLNFSAGDKVTGSFGFLGKQGSVATTAIASSTYANPSTNDFYESNDVAVTIGGSPVSVMSGNLSLTNNDGPRPVLGSQYTDGIRLGRFEANAQLNTYFNDSTLVDQFIADTYTTLQIVFTDTATGSGNYTLLFPRVKIVASNVEPGANNLDVMANITLQPVYDPTEGCTLKITRAPTP